MEIEAPYFDKTGRIIKDGAVLKVFHFIGRRRKRHYMYQQIRLKESNGKLYYDVVHLDSKNNSVCWLIALVDKETRIISHAEVIQQQGEEHWDL